MSSKYISVDMGHFGDSSECLAHASALITSQDFQSALCCKGRRQCPSGIDHVRNLTSEKLMDTLIVQLREARVNGRNVSHIVVRTPPLWYRIALDPLTDRHPDGMAFLGVPVTYHEAEEEGDVSEFSLVFEE